MTKDKRVRLKLQRQGGPRDWRNSDKKSVALQRTGPSAGTRLCSLD